MVIQGNKGVSISAFFGFKATGHETKGSKTLDGTGTAIGLAGYDAKGTEDPAQQSLLDTLNFLESEGTGGGIANTESNPLATLNAAAAQLSQGSVDYYGQAEKALLFDLSDLIKKVDPPKTSLRNGTVTKGYSDIINILKLEKLKYDQLQKKGALQPHERSTHGNLKKTIGRLEVEAKKIPLMIKEALKGDKAEMKLIGEQLHKYYNDKTGQYTIPDSVINTLDADGNRETYNDEDGTTITWGRRKTDGGYYEWAPLDEKGIPLRFDKESGTFINGRLATTDFGKMGFDVASMSTVSQEPKTAGAEDVDVFVYATGETTTDAAFKGSTHQVKKEVNFTPPNGVWVKAHPDGTPWLNDGNFQPYLGDLMTTGTISAPPKDIRDNYIFIDTKKVVVGSQAVYADSAKQVEIGAATTFELQDHLGNKIFKMQLEGVKITAANQNAWGGMRHDDDDSGIVRASALAVMIGDGSSIYPNDKSQWVDHSIDVEMSKNYVSTAGSLQVDVDGNELGANPETRHWNTDTRSHFSGGQGLIAPTKDGEGNYIFNPEASIRRSGMAIALNGNHTTSFNSAVILRDPKDLGYFEGDGQYRNFVNGAMNGHTLVLAQEGHLDGRNLTDVRKSAHRKNDLVRVGMLDYIQYSVLDQSKDAGKTKLMKNTANNASFAGGEVWIDNKPDSKGIAPDSGIVNILASVYTDKDGVTGKAPDKENPFINDDNYATQGSGTLRFSTTEDQPDVDSKFQGEVFDPSEMAKDQAEAMELYAADQAPLDLLLSQEEIDMLGYEMGPLEQGETQAMTSFFGNFVTNMGTSVPLDSGLQQQYQSQQQQQGISGGLGDTLGDAMNDPTGGGTL